MGNTIKKRIIFFILLGHLASCVEDKKLEAYYENGHLNYEVPLKEGKKHGEMKGYFETGELREVSNWKDGKLNGKLLHYYKNGKIEQQHYMVNGIRSDSSVFYRPNGSVQEVQYHDSLGRLYDYKKINQEGEQRQEEESKQVILLADADTIDLNQVYTAYVRLGNRTGFKIEATLGDPNDSLLYTRQPRLEKIDSVTAKIVLEPTKEGVNTYEGIVIEVFDNPKKLILHPFKGAFLVEGK